MGGAEGAGVGGKLVVGFDDGLAEGFTVGATEGESDATGVGSADGVVLGVTLGDPDGWADIDGLALGDADGSAETLGANDGEADGSSEDTTLGRTDGLAVTATVGLPVGTPVGANVLPGTIGILVTGASLGLKLTVGAPVRGTYSIPALISKSSSPSP